MEINLEEYEILLDGDGNATHDAGVVSLSKRTDGSIVRVNYVEVADYYGLRVVQAADAEHNDVPERNASQPLHKSKTVVAWTDEQTKFMLSMYKKYMHKVGPLQQFKNKKQLWSTISNELWAELGVEFTSTQVENRWKNILKQTKLAAKNNRTSGSTIMRTAFDDEIAQITALDDSIEPEILMTPKTIKRKVPASSVTSSNVIVPPKRSLMVPENAEEDPQPSTSSAPSSASTCCEPTVENADLSSPLQSERRRSIKDIQANFLDAYLLECENRQIRAAEKQKRHAEKMEKIDKLTNVFETLANNIAKQ